MVLGGSTRSRKHLFSQIVDRLLPKVRFHLRRESGARGSVKGAGTGHNPPNFVTLEERVQRIEASGFFDANWYTEKQDLIDGGVAAIRHYLLIGSKSGLAPHPLFDVVWYTSQNPSADTLDSTPLEHFIAHGPDVSMSPLFDPVFYRVQARNIGELHPTLHFLRHGATEQISPHPLFDSAFYCRQDPQLMLGTVNPLTHFLEHGARNGYNPNRYFDSSWYLAHYRLTSINPLVHFILVGAREGNRPHPNLDLKRFTLENDLDPLDAFLKIVNEGRVDVLDTNVGRSYSRLNGTTSTQQGDHEPVFDAVCTTPPDVNSNVEVKLDLDGVDVISFDVWDTLLRRDCHPDEIKVRSARWLLLNGHDFIRPAFRGVRPLFAARINAENASAPKGEFEYRYQSAIDLWLDAVLVRGPLVEQRAKLKHGLLQHEILAETSVTRPDLPMRRAVESLNVPAIFASDFYMPSPFIKTLLRHHGYGERLMTGFVSSERYETKRSGAMFDRLLLELGTSADRILHVGDNLVADVEKPVSRGLRALHYQSPSELARHAHFEAGFKSWQAGDGALHRARITRMCEDLALEQDGPDADLRSAGARLAPVAVGYLLDILERALCDRTDVIYFFTREGLFLKRVYDALVHADPYDTPSPRSEVLEVSRRATFAASLEDVGIAQLMRLWGLYSTQSVKGLVASLNLDAALVRRLCVRFDIDFDEPITHPWANEKIHNIISCREFSEHARKRCAEQRELLTGYLDSKGFFDQPLRHIVDIGWRGTIQDNIANLNSKVFLRGHYLGLFQYINRQMANTDKNGWLFNENAGETLSIRDVAALEMLTNGSGGRSLATRKQPRE